MSEQKGLLLKINRISLIVLVTIFSTRIWAMGFFYIFRQNHQFVETIVNDPWHHYHAGLLLIIFGYLLRKFGKAEFISAIGLGIFLEEWPVFLSDLGFNTNYLYHTKIDFISIVVVVGLVFIVSRVFSEYRSQFK